MKKVERTCRLRVVLACSCQFNCIVRPARPTNHATSVASVPSRSRISSRLAVLQRA